MAMNLLGGMIFALSRGRIEILFASILCDAAKLPLHRMLDCTARLKVRHVFILHGPRSEL